ncbi:Pzf1p [Saccharomyces cerevisiae YJM244]|nr:Pzf1p [Saccharomyces cerevisiae YJM244]
MGGEVLNNEGMPLAELKQETIPISRSESSESLNSLTSTRSSSSNRPKTYFCDYDGCDKAFTRPSILTEHQLSVHQGLRAFQCDKCAKSFVKKSHLERHLYTHSDTKPFQCSYCGKGVTTRQQLKRHEVTHTKSFICPEEGCNLRFYKHPQLRAHILSVHLHKLTCPHCNKSFQRPYRLRNHISKHHDPEVENPYQCTFAGCCKEFRIWSQLQSHIKNDHPKLKCPICSKPCVGENGLQMHMIIHDDSLVTKNWKCHICPDMSFSRKHDLLTHYGSIHTEEDIPLELKYKISEIQQLVQYQGVQLGNGKHSNEQDEEKISNRLRKRRKLTENNNVEFLQNEVDLEKRLESGENGLNLLLNTVGRKYRCFYNNCSRTFKTKEKYEKHIDKHKIHELKLKILQEKEENKTLVDQNHKEPFIIQKETQSAGDK